MPLVASTTICVCWWVALDVITTSSFLQVVAVIAVPTWEVQVRVLDCLSNLSSMTLGIPVRN